MGGISNEIDSITKQIEALNTQISNLSTNTSSGGTLGNTIVGNKGNNTSYSNDEAIHAIIKEMYQNAQAWHSASVSERQRLDQRNLQLGAQLNNLGVNARRDGGTWYDGAELLFEKYKKYIYHTGGFVGDEPLKPNEKYIKAENGELVLTGDQQDGLAAQIDRISVMTEKFTSDAGFLSAPMSALSNISRGAVSNAITTNNNSRSVVFNQGDVIIQGTVMGPKELAENLNKYIKVTESMVNDFARQSGVKW